MFVGTSWEASRGPLGGSCEASWEPLRSFLWHLLCLLGSVWGLLGGLLGGLVASLGSLCGPPGGLRGRKAGIVGSCSPSWTPLRAVLKPSWAVLGASWADLRPSWAVLGASWGPLGPSWGPLGAEKVTRQAAGNPRGHAASPGGFENFGSRSLEDSSGLRAEAQGIGQRT